MLIIPGVSVLIKLAIQLDTKKSKKYLLARFVLAPWKFKQNIDHIIPTLRFSFGGSFMKIKENRSFLGDLIPSFFVFTLFKNLLFCYSPVLPKKKDIRHYEVIAVKKSMIKKQYKRQIFSALMVWNNENSHHCSYPIYIILTNGVKMKHNHIIVKYFFWFTCLQLYFQLPPCKWIAIWGKGSTQLCATLWMLQN